MLTNFELEIGDLDQDDLQQYCKDTFTPDECCNEDELKEWAEANGWVEKSELDTAKEEIAELEERVKELEEEAAE